MMSDAMKKALLFIAALIAALMAVSCRRDCGPTVSSPVDDRDGLIL